MSNRPIANHDTPDPWVIPSPLQPGIFYLTFTLGNRVEIWSSDNLESFHDQNPALRKTVVWQPPPGSPWSADIWAPELHFLYGTWWIYAAGAPPSEGNKGHRTIVLRCTDPNRDPMNGNSWVFEGPLRGLPNHQWSIDATVFSPDPAPDVPGGRPDEQRRWYVCYSGWPLGDYSDTQQDLFLARLRNPVEADESSLTCIGRAELPWERPDGGRRGVNEGPTWVALSNGQWKGIVYSAHGSWTSEYKLGLLQFMGSPSDDLCSQKLWRKRQTPLLVSDKDMGGPFGPGHASFVSNPADGRVFCVYHGTEKDDEGWNNRKGRVLVMAPDVFLDNARTMCCAYSICGPVADTHGVPPTGPAAVQHPQGQSWQHQQQQQQPPQSSQQHQQPGSNQSTPGYGQNWQGQQGQSQAPGYFPNQNQTQTPNQSWQGHQQQSPPLQQQGYHSPPQPSSSPYQSPPPHTSSPFQGQQQQHQQSYPFQGQQQQQPQQPQYPGSPPLPSHSPASYPGQQQQPGGQQYPGSPPPPQQQHAYPGSPPLPSQSPALYPGQQQQQPNQYPGQQQPQNQYQQQYSQYSSFPPPPQHHSHPQAQTQPQPGYPPINHQMAPGGAPGSSQYGQPSTSSSGTGAGTGTGVNFDKYANKIQEKIPAQYQGYFNKAKKFLK